MTSRDFRALHSNDPEYAERIARAPFKGGGGWASPDGDFTLTRKSIPNSGAENCPILLVIRNPDLARVRLDKVLVRGLRRNRKDVLDLVESGVLRVQNASPKVLRRLTPAVVAIECHAIEGHEVLQFLRGMPD